MPDNVIHNNITINNNSKIKALYEKERRRYLKVSSDISVTHHRGF